jgi:dihydrofolate synthase / folylpolyglutamate synthase
MIQYIAMVQIPDLKTAESILATFIPQDFSSGRYNLVAMRKLMTMLGKPQDKIRVIHVAGTSGKTSTSYYIASLFRHAGYKTGLTISPHIEKITERIQIGDCPISDQVFCHELQELLNNIENTDINPTYFEILVALAYRTFEKQTVDYAVVEVGLGGLLDGTNVVNNPSKVCVITDIGLDHTRLLGDTIEAIATQKAGIIRNGNTVFAYHQGQVVDQVLTSASIDNNADLHFINSYADPTLDLPLFQRRNLTLAQNVADFVLERDHQQSITSDTLQQTAQKTVVPVRMETFRRLGKTIVVDGAHNVQKISALTESMRAMYTNRQICLMVSFGESKLGSVYESLKNLRTLSDIVIITSFQEQQDTFHKAISVDELARTAQDVGFSSVTIEPNYRLALEKLESLTTDIGLITGSLYLGAKIRPLVRGWIV